VSFFPHNVLTVSNIVTNKQTNEQTQAIKNNTSLAVTEETTNQQQKFISSLKRPFKVTQGRGGKRRES